MGSGYETISGATAKPFFAAMAQADNGNYLAEIRRHDNGDIAVTVHGEPGFKTLTYGNGRMELSEISGGWQTLTVVRGNNVQVTQQAWNSIEGLNGPITTPAITDEAARQESLTAIQKVVEARLNVLDRSRDASKSVQEGNERIEGQTLAQNMPSKAGRVLG